MDLWIIEGGDFVPYTRHGQCHQCGQCCCTHTIEYRMSVSFSNDSEPGDDVAEDWSDWEGWSVLYAQGVYFWFKVTDIEDEPNPCPAYDAETHQCTIWQDPEKFRPVCRYWPFNPEDIVKFEGCGFSFEREPLEAAQ